MSLEEDEDEDDEGDGEFAFVRTLVIPLTLGSFCPWNSPLPLCIIMSMRSTSPSTEVLFPLMSQSHQRRLPSRGLIASI